MSFLKRFLAKYQYDEIADLQHGWTVDDANWLLTVFKQESGRQLKKRLTNIAFRASINACAPVRADDPAKESGDYRRGRAQGVVDAIQAIEQHMNAELFKQDKDFSPAEAHPATIGTQEPAPVL